VTLSWKRALVLLVAGIVGTLAVIPYQLALLPTLSFPLPLILLSAVINGAIFLAIAIALGTWLGARAGLGTPVIDAALRGEPIAARVRAFASLALALGAGSAVAVIALDAAAFVPLVPELSGVARPPTPPAWSGLLATLYGAITEETLVRYGLMSLAAWVVTRVSRSATAYWAAILIAAVLFGLGHLPATAQILPLTPVVVARAVALNGLVGVAAGWLYWRHGLESAMLAHGAADLVLHVILPLLMATSA